jgi:electron transfer flavoprotein beta subunit
MPSVAANHSGGKMEIIVCIKQILDPDLPPAKFAIDAQTNRVIPPEGIPPVINPYDALAVEGALRLKEKKGGRITVLTLGGKAAEDIVRKALAMGADEGRILSAPDLERLDSFGTAHLLSQAIRKVGRFDLVLCGRQAADWDNGAVGAILAEYLGIPVVSRAKEIAALDGKVVVDRVSTGGFETLEVELPALVTVSNELGKARIPSGWGIITAAKKEIPFWSQPDIGVHPSAQGRLSARNKLLKLFAPSLERKCEMVRGETPSEAAEKLVQKILERKVL